MPELPVAADFALGLGMIVAGFMAMRRNVATLANLRWIVWCLAVVGVLAGVPLGSIATHQDAQTRVFGFPLTVVVLELHDGHWLDFVGLMTPIGFVMNTLAWAAVWQVLLTIILSCARKRPMKMAKGSVQPSGRPTSGWS